ncbi:MULTISPECIES: hypothetical protein [Klebsiella/Raoultella group]|jgi:hypothetical protein|uniref:hypothetical protein n=1 Tax=Klebsiella/Raoultella group TaxID=2890311 RepID=UPI000D5281BB|nr:hypothetical protein [Klebsiella michiganensis]MDM9663154.1 hypothetical protein [Raoultella planticola]QLX15531.1 hypothetical protein HV230_13770 [Klebsiella oxytoca]MBS0928072.1 hypothetical protein [Klebsiella michiganensis]MDG9985784.1 hypothetical protein [Klebsiella michiganensis]MDH0833316.1 hypothetical protein [Klebsiella michiganensis]
MPVIKKISAIRRSFYPEVGLAIDAENETIDVKYTVVSVTINADFSATARVSTQVFGFDESGEISVPFQYSGTGNPINEAESALN